MTRDLAAPGRDYTLIPVHRSGAFHPKLIVALGKLKGALFVGSHNTTLAGFGLNDEVTNEFRTSGAGARQGAAVIRAALDYLRTFVPTGLSDLSQVFGAVRRNVPWLDGPVAAGSNERILLTTTGEDADLWTRIRPLIPKRPSTAFVCGPFFDKKLGFLQQLLDDVKPRRLLVGMIRSPSRSTLARCAGSAVRNSSTWQGFARAQPPRIRDEVSSRQGPWFTGS